MKYLLLLFLAGCAAHLETPAPSPENAPVNEFDRPRVVGYLDNDGAFGLIVKARRRSAYKKMHESCKGAYQIDKEYPDGNWWYIVFSCVKS